MVKNERFNLIVLGLSALDYIYYREVTRHDFFFCRRGNLNKMMSNYAATQKLKKKMCYNSKKKTKLPIWNDFKQEIWKNDIR